MRKTVSTKNNQSKSAGSRGGARPGAGRKPGQVNSTTIAIRELAREHVPTALVTLTSIAADPKAPAAARVTAAVAIIDRAYGKPAQAVEVEVGGTIRFIIEAGPDAPRSAA